MSSTNLSFAQWRSDSRRPIYSAANWQNDQQCAALIIALICNPKNPRRSIKSIDNYARRMEFALTGAWHPDYPPPVRKKFSEAVAPIERLDIKLRSALHAAGLLLDHWEAGRNVGGISTIISSVTSTTSESDDRKRIWSNHTPIIHLALALKIQCIEHGLTVTNSANLEGLERSSLIRAFLGGTIPFDWVGKVLIEAERYAYRIYFQRLIPNPERMIYLEPRMHDIAQMGKISP